MQLIYGMGIGAFEALAAGLAQKLGAGFALTDAVKAAIRKYQPQY